MIRTTHSLFSQKGAEKTLACNYDLRNMIEETIRLCEPCQRLKIVTTVTNEETIKLSVNENRSKNIHRYIYTA